VSQQPLVGDIDAKDGRVVVAGHIETVNLDDQSFDISGSAVSLSRAD
jgi:hypothetical protein